MSMSTYRRSGALAVLALAAAACAGAHEPAPAAVPPPVSVANGHQAYGDADVAFMQGMIAHHAQALDMTALVPERSTNERLRVLAERIEQTQLNEIQRMSRWLRERGETVPEPSSYRDHDMHDMAGHGGHMMPGMLTPEQMAELAAASGPEFDRLFLVDMIQHHQGALTMVAELQSAGGGLEAQIYRFASDVDADQRAEIARMQGMLTDLQ